MHDWQSADDERERISRENESKGGSRKGFTGPGMDMVNAANEAAQRGTRDNQIPAHLQGTAARAYALANGLPVPEADEYGEDAFTGILGGMSPLGAPSR